MGMTTLCYIEKDNKYLMLHRIKKEHDINKDKWIGVGGHFEHGESPEDCMFREVMEETGLTPLSYRFCGIVTFLSDMGTEKEAWEYIEFADKKCRECFTSWEEVGKSYLLGQVINYPGEDEFKKVIGYYCSAMKDVKSPWINTPF